MHYFVSFLVLQSSWREREREKEKESCFFTLILFLMSCDYNCSLTFPNGAVGWHAVCGYGIF